MWNKEEPEVAGGGVRSESERRVVAWLGKSVIFKGELISSEDMVIDGRVEGIIEVRDHALTIGPDAQIHADIEAKTVVVRGSVVGSITAIDKVVLDEHAVVEGDVLAARVRFTDGAVMRGRVETGKKKAAVHQPAQEAERELAAV